MSEQPIPLRSTELPVRAAWRLGGLVEAPLVARLAEDSFEPEFREAWTAGQIAGLLGSSESWLELGEADGALIAFGLCRKAADEVELLLCATAPDWRQQGLGMELIARVAEQCRLRGARRLFLEVRSSNEAALALYRKAGFCEDGRRPGYYRTVSGDRIDAITLSVEP
jgi:ribosomal-protein-alanine N-acetyltransferase